MSEIDPYNIVAIGGGHGLASTVEALTQEFPDANIYGLTTVVDSGSASGRLRTLAGEVGDQPYGFGDLRNNLGRASGNLGGELFGVRFDEHADPDLLAALGEDMRMAIKYGERSSDLTDAVLGDTLTYGYLLSETEHGLKGHTYGNLVLAGLASRHGLWEGVEIANRWLDTKAHIQTLTTKAHHMHMWDDGEVYHTEEVIDDRKVTNPETAHIWLDEGTLITRGAYRAIARSDSLVVAAGSLWTSTLPALSVEGVPEAIAVQSLRPEASRLVVANLVHEENAGTMPLSGYLRKIKAAAGGAHFTVLHNVEVDTIANALCADEDLEGGYPARLVSTVGVKHDENDPLAHRRSAAIHDPAALGGAIRGAHELIRA